MRYLQKKVASLEQLIITVHIPTIEREFAKDCLLEHGNEELIRRKLDHCQHIIISLRCFTVGRLKLACNMVSHYLPNDVYTALLERYE
jgi:hypothetical protein